MSIVEDESDGSGDTFNLEKMVNFFTLYKFPVILAGIGILFFLVAASLLFKNITTTDKVEFITESTASAKSRIRIDIAGSVMKPGVYEMEDGDRIIDALSAAGGLSQKANRVWIEKNINKAAKLIDGGKIYIPSVAGTTLDQAQSSSIKGQNLSDLSSAGNLLGVTTGKVNINTASQVELEALPGVGPVTAGKIISGRPYQTITELKTRKIIGQKLYDQLKDLLVVF